MAQNSDKSTLSFSDFRGLKKKFSEMKRQYLTKASEQDLRNLIILMAHPEALPDEQKASLLRIFVTPDVAAELQKREKKREKLPTRRNRPTNVEPEPSPEPEPDRETILRKNRQRFARSINSDR